MTQVSESFIIKLSFKFRVLDFRYLKCNILTRNLLNKFFYMSLKEEGIFEPCTQNFKY